MLVAGRSGSAMTAQIGVMRVTEELDALAVMGIPHTVRLVLPKVIALAIAMPLVVLWTDAVALIGGMIAAQCSSAFRTACSCSACPRRCRSRICGSASARASCSAWLIALIACHFGLRIEPNTESLGTGTTNSVVTAITMVIIVDAAFAVMFSDVGIF